MSKEEPNQPKQYGKITVQIPGSGYRVTMDFDKCLDSVNFGSYKDNQPVVQMVKAIQQMIDAQGLQADGIVEKLTDLMCATIPGSDVPPHFKAAINENISNGDHLQQCAYDTYVMGNQEDN